MILLTTEHHQGQVQDHGVPTVIISPRVMEMQREGVATDGLIRKENGTRHGYSNYISIVLGYAKAVAWSYHTKG